MAVIAVVLTRSSAGRRMNPLRLSTFSPDPGGSIQRVAEITGRARKTGARW